MQRDRLDVQKFHVHASDWDTAPLHGHDFLELAFIARGEISHVRDGRTERVRCGEYFIVDHGVRHSMQRVSEEPLYVVNLLFYPEFIDRTLAGKRCFDDVLNTYLLKFGHKTLNEPAMGRVFGDEDGQVVRIVNEILEEYEAEKYGYIECIRSLLVKLLIVTMRKIGGKEPPVEDGVTAALVAYVSSRYAQRIRLEDAARELGYSAGYLSHVFASRMGVSFVEYLQRIRVENACRLLEREDLSVSQVALQVGYSDVKYFGQVFRRILSLSPREYRKLHRK